MSKKDLYKAFTERGKVKNKYYIPIKLNKVKQNYQTVLDIKDIEELEDKLMQNSTFFEMKRYKKEYYNEGYNWNFNVIKRLVDSFVGKHIDELQLKCMSYPRKYRHSLWKWTLCSFSEYLYINSSGYFLDWSVIKSHYLDENNIIQRCPSRLEYENNLAKLMNL